MKQELQRCELTFAHTVDSSDMNSKDFDVLVTETFDRCQTLLCKKGEEYASAADRLHNFYASSAISGLTAQQILWAFATKHLTSIRDGVQGVRPWTKELADEKIDDAISYLVLLKALIRDGLQFK